MAAIPLQIRALRDAGIFQIVWSPQRCLRYPFKLLRCECPCAACVNEFTGERLLNPENVPETVAPLAVEFSGNYALKIQWSDGHATGLYSWDLLDRLGALPQVTPCEQQG